MSKASELISSSITGDNYKSIYIGGKTFKAYPPTILNICHAVHEFGKADIENKNYMEIAQNFSEVKKAILTGVSYLMRGKEQYDPNLRGIMAADTPYPPALDNITIDEMNEALKVCFSLIESSDFDVCNFEIERPDGEANSHFAGNRTFLGQIATFIEYLHLTYREVLEEIPYRDLLIMQRDKLHQVYGETLKYKGARENPKFAKMIK